MRPSPKATQALLDRAIAVVGSQAKLGRAIGKTQNAIWHARTTGRVTAEMALAIDEATAGTIAKEALRPDVYQPTEASAL